jgi:hypothetical protein
MLGCIVYSVLAVPSHSRSASSGLIAEPSLSMVIDPDVSIDGELLNQIVSGIHAEQMVIGSQGAQQNEA